MQFIATIAQGSQKLEGPRDGHQASRLQRVDARGELVVAMTAGRTRPQRILQEGAAKIRFPRTGGDVFEAILINTAGGLTGGDRLKWTVRVGEDARASVTTQACEKVYRAGQGHAEVACRLTVGRGGHLAWLPQETIAYDGSALRRRLDVEIAQGGSALVLEATLMGRQASGETVREALFRDRWRVRVAEQLVHAEDLTLEGDVARLLQRPPVSGGAVAFATVLAIADDVEDKLDRARAILGEDGGASFWRVGGTGKLLARIVASNGMALRARLVPLIELLNGQAGLPKIWTS
jgi:urease accessory protein